MRSPAVGADRRNGQGAPLGCYQGRPTIYPGIAGANRMTMMRDIIRAILI
jgi:hypothetical protein